MSEMTKDLANSIFKYVDGKLIWKVNVKRAKIGQLAGTKDKRYSYVKYNNIKYLTHRIVFLMHNGYLPIMVDHINGNTFDNRIENLREATPTQNAMNRPVINKNKLGSANVHWVNKSNKYRVRLSVDGKRKCFGYYDTIELASMVAEQARQKYYGNFAYKGDLNG